MKLKDLFITARKGKEGSSIGSPSDIEPTSLIGVIDPITRPYSVIPKDIKSNPNGTTVEIQLSRDKTPLNGRLQITFPVDSDPEITQCQASHLMLFLTPGEFFFAGGLDITPTNPVLMICDRKTTLIMMEANNDKGVLFWSNAGNGHGDMAMTPPHIPCDSDWMIGVTLPKFPTDNPQTTTG